MEHYRTTSHTRYDIKLHFVWITKYRKAAITGEIAVRVREIIRQICAEYEVEISKGHVSKDHVHLFVSCPPHVMEYIKTQNVEKEDEDFKVDS